MDPLFITIVFFTITLIVLILELQNQKRQLQKEQARFQASINSINVGFMIADTQMQIVMINTAAKQIIFHQGNSSSPAILRNSPDSHPSYSIEEIQASLGQSFDLKAKITEALSQKTTISIKDIPFGLFYLHIFITPIVILKGKKALDLEHIGAVVLIEDITQQIMLERSKDEFFSIASHELRTPLTAIRGNTALIEQYYPAMLKDPSLKEIVHDIHESSTRLINIVNDFLDVSRLEQGRIEYHLAEFGLLGLAQNVIKELAPMAAQQGVFLKIEEGESPPIVFADKEKVKQVLINLIGNALKFTTTGGITLRFGSQGNMVKCEVADTGKGIPLSNQKLLFHKFQQASNNILTRDATGTGLGLYISQLMVEAQGGVIKLENSVENKGSTFSFTLPTKSGLNLLISPSISQLTNAGQK